MTVQICLAGGDGPLAGGTLDTVLRARAGEGSGVSRVIVRTADVRLAGRRIAELGGRVRRQLPGGSAVVAEVADSHLVELARTDGVAGVSLDRPIQGALQRTAATIGSRWVSEQLGFDGTGIGVAIIDSGVIGAHDDLGENRVVHFVDFVDGEAQPQDRYGHGTHVAGIIVGSGHDSNGARRGIAPGAHLVVLRTLDRQGEGFISDAIAAMDYAIAQRAAYNIRVINLSVAAGVYESYKTDPLTLAAARAVDAGIVVVTAAGNQGRSAAGLPQYAGITAPGNAPWVLTVGASSHNGTADRADDTIAPFSSMGPSAIDHVVKPDLVAPGVGIESLADADSTLFAARANGRVWGAVPTASEPYLSLSGTSMSAPVVTGTIALMLQANPSLKPDAVKAILQTTAEPHANYSPLAQGAGFLNARAAVELAVQFASSRTAAQDLNRILRAYEPADGASLEGCATGVDCVTELTRSVADALRPAADTTVWNARGDGSIRGSRRAADPTRADANAGIFE